MDWVLELRAAGYSATGIARRTGIPRSTVRDWIAGHVPARSRVPASGCPACGGSEHDFVGLPTEYVYLLGLYLGDGCISAHPRGVYKLRVVLDLRYPAIIEASVDAIRAVMPQNKVRQLRRRGGYVDDPEYSNVEVYAYSKAWPCLFPQHGPGRKHTRPIQLTGWQRELVRARPESLLRGLVHSDGCRFMNTGRGWRHPRYSFHNRSADILRIFCETCDLLGLRWTSAPNTVYVSRKADVAVLDRFIGPKA